VSTPSAAQAQDWFARLADLPPAGRARELERLAQADPALAARVSRLLAADAELAGAPTEPLLPQLALLRIGDDWSGREIGGYRVRERLGAGGMGTVWRAESLQQPGSFAAIKFLRAERDDAALRRRFQLEAQVLQSLQHPGIAQLIASGSDADGTPFVVMELVEGTGLLAYADSNKLTVPQRITLFGKVCAAVAHAHARQVVHRDIKAGNILVTAQGQPKLLDFGIAKPLSGHFGLQYLERTATAQRFFSAASAAPEQLSGAATGPPCDIYALGALLYELLSGEPPLQLQGLSAGQVELAIHQQTPQPLAARVSSLAPGIGNARARQRGLSDRQALADALRGEPERIVARALRKQPAQRQPSVEALLAELRALRRGAAAPSLLRRLGGQLRSRPLLPLLAVLLVVAGLAVWQPRRDVQPAAAETMVGSGEAGGGEAGSVDTGVAPEAAAATAVPAATAEMRIALAQSLLQRGENQAALTELAQAQALLPGGGDGRHLQVRLLALRAAAATRLGDFPAAALALQQADSLAPAPAERAELDLQRARLLAARGREAEAAEVLRRLAATALPTLRSDDALAAQIRQQLEALPGDAASPVSAAPTSAAPASAAPASAAADAPAAAAAPAGGTRNLAALEKLAASLQSAQAGYSEAEREAGMHHRTAAPAEIAARTRKTVAVPPDATPPGAADPATAPATVAGTPSSSTPAAGTDAAAIALANAVEQASALNAKAAYAEALRVLESALESQRRNPALRHSDDYRLGVLAAAIARHGSAPSAETATRLRHELTRDAWLSSDPARARWREQAAIAQKLGVGLAQ
jgi:eukaryotic-like serine/threonine-protein kinase